MYAEVNPPSISSPPWCWLWRGGWQEDAHSKQCTHPAGMWSSTCTSWRHHPALSHSHWADPSSSPHAAWRPHPVHHGHSIRPPDYFSLLHAAWYFIIASCCLATSPCTSWTQHQGTRLLHHCLMLPGDLTLYIMDLASSHQITSSLPQAAWLPPPVHHGHSIRAPDYFIIASCCLVTSPCTSWT